MNNEKRQKCSLKAANDCPPHREQSEAKARIVELDKKVAKKNSEAKTKIAQHMTKVERNFNNSFENYDWLHNEQLEPTYQKTGTPKKETELSKE